MVTNTKLTTSEFWTAPRPGFYFKRHDKNHNNDVFILKYIPPTTTGTCIEIGSYPGPHLATFGDLGYELYGVDFNPDNVIGLPEWLKKEGFKVGKFWNSDIFEFDPKMMFDVVASFGFIEHFTNYEEIILKHAFLVNFGGYLLITTPNFRGTIQYWLHKTFDKDNLAIHNVQSMRPEVWAKVLKEHGFEIIYHGYFGGFWFWKGQPELGYIKRKLIWLIERIIIRIRHLLWFQSPGFSAYCGIVARRINN